MLWFESMKIPFVLFKIEIKNNSGISLSLY